MKTESGSSLHLTKIALAYSLGYEVLAMTKHIVTHECIKIDKIIFQSRFPGDKIYLQ